MSTRLAHRIMDYLTDRKFRFKLYEHEPVYTSSTASDVLQHPEFEGTKSLVLKTERGIAVVTVSGIERVNFKQIKRFLGVRSMAMADVDLVRKELETEIGGIAPFGYGDDITLIVSETLFDQRSVYFNPGRNDATVQVNGKDFEIIMLDQGAKIIG